MKKILIALFFLFGTASLAHSQGWEIIAWVMMNKEEARVNENIKSYFSPYLNELVGKRVTLVSTYNIYLRFNEKRKDTGKEVKEEEASQYINRSYTIEKIFYDVEDFFNDGVLFKLRANDGSYIYVQRGYKQLVKDVLSSTFKDFIYSPIYFRQRLTDRLDKFSDVSSVKLEPFSMGKNGMFAVSQFSRNDTLLYSIQLAVFQKSRIESNNECVVILNGNERRRYNVDVKCDYSSDIGDYKYIYYADIVLTKDELKEFSEKNITDVRVGYADMENIRQYYYQRFRYACAVMYNYPEMYVEESFNQQESFQINF